MKSEKAPIVIGFVLITLLLISTFALTGCKKTHPTAPPATEQTTCPVMGGTINANIFTEYKGKKVYFCCPSCKDKFEKEPEKYISKLPQFQN
jgi:YHS domain-containing protein